MSSSLITTSADGRTVTRQILASAPDLNGELRYFEVAPGGWTTLERHQHVHAVTILRGAGRALVGETVYEVGPLDLFTVPSWFRWWPYSLCTQAG